MENIHENIRSNADIYLKIWDFLNFYTDIHDSIGCKNPGCRLKINCDVWSGYLKRADKTDNEKRLFFICHCKMFESVFFCAYKLYFLDKIPL